MRENAPISVTISRQMGSGGAYLGYLTAQALGFRYIDRDMLRQSARELGADIDKLELLDERSSGLIETILKGFSFGAPETGVIQTSKPIYDKDLFASERDVIREIARNYNSVFIGRAGFFILKDFPRVLRVFTHAPMEFRIDRVMQAQKMSRSQAEAAIQESDRRRARFVRDVAGAHWLSAGNYHLTLDTSVIGFKPGAELISEMVRRKWLSEGER